MTPIEMYELAVPVLIECKELIPDSGGAGKFRGGLGQRLVLPQHLVSRPMNIYLATERVKYPCFGVVGGNDGRGRRVLQDGEPVFAKGKHPARSPMSGSTVELPGGGGWGDPPDRSRELITEDLRLGLVTSECAKPTTAIRPNDAAELDEETIMARLNGRVAIVTGAGPASARDRALQLAGEGARWSWSAAGSRPQDAVTRSPPAGGRAFARGPISRRLKLSKPWCAG